MRKRRAFAAGGLLLAVAALAVSGLAAGSSGRGGVTDGLHFDPSLQRTRARNLRLQSMIVLLTERRVHGRASSESLIPASAAPAVRVAPQRTESTPAPAEASTTADENECDSNYEGACLNPDVSDYDCEGGDGNGPDYTGEVRVVGDDHFGLDADGDGIGCEAE
jgi:hypothetical protein